MLLNQVPLNCHLFRHRLTGDREVMIVSYETLRTLTAYLANCSIGLLLCDEGHRLKNSGGESFRL
jgi:SNF2 family DNA or RNA helicase